MVYNKVLYLLFSLSIFLSFCNANDQENFLHCMYIHSSSQYTKEFKYIHPRGCRSYSDLLRSAEQNPRWLNSTSLKPIFIITPYNAEEIRASIVCARKHYFQIRVKSGGHDYEGLSYVSRATFIIVDLINLRSISIDLEQETAWVESGATLGELYYSIAHKSRVLGFPAGTCPSVGVGGHFSGGGLGTMARKRGLAADNIVDAYIIDVNGIILDRESMGEDLFWAIRGGGGASFGIILAWKIKLVRIPQVVTVFTLDKKLDTQGMKLVRKWQGIAHKLPDDIMLRIVLAINGNSSEKEKNVVASFNSLYLGNVKELLPLMSKRFPELGLKRKDCIEMSWIESVLYFAGFERDYPWEVLLDRVVRHKSYFKAKSDYVMKPMPESAYEGIRKKLMQQESAYMIMDPFGGIMGRIPMEEIPFPHRKGNLFSIQYVVSWNVEGESKRCLEWIRRMYTYMKVYVSDSPRGAYLNYRDLDIGSNMEGNTSYSEALVWGRKYFKGNFERLGRVKNVVDPENFFRYEQSIPLLS